MDEKEKNQKTVLAIIAGLAIGGLLVWVFSSVPGTPAQDQESENTEQAADTNSASEESEGNTVAAATTERAPATVTVGAGSVAVADQSAGSAVTLGEITYPSTRGWLVVREELQGGILGNILGAARYNTDDGLLPKTIELLRSTEAGKKYHVIFYSENGDNIFDLADDVAVTTAGGGSIEAVFTAN